MLSNRLLSKLDAKNVVFLILSVVLAIHCGQSRNPSETSGPNDRAASPNYLTTAGDSVLIPGFSIRLQLSAQANAALSSKHETIMVHAWFNGQPKDTTTKEYRESGEMFLSEIKVELDTARTAFIDGARFSSKQLDALVDKDIHVLVNVYSGRRTIPENILNCDIVDEKMSQVKGKTISLSCKLIAESDSLPILPTPGYTPSGPPLSKPPLAPTK